jgi:hypothetical protein
MTSPKNKTLTPKTEEPSFAAKVVRKFKEAEDRLTQFMRDPDVRELLQQYHDLVLQRNEQLGEAVRAVKSELSRSDRAKLLIEGIGAQKKYGYKYDIDHLRAYLPPEQVAMIITEETVYNLNVEDLTRLVRQKEIDETIVRQAYKEAPAGVASMPGTPKVYEMPPLALEEEVD